MVSLVDVVLKCLTRGINKFNLFAKEKQFKNYTEFNLENNLLVSHYFVHCTVFNFNFDAYTITTTLFEKKKLKQ